MYNHLLYLAYWVVNVIVIFTLGRLFPGLVGLGVNKFAPLESAIYSGFWLTFFVWTMWDLVISQEVKLEPAPLAFVYFFLVNALGLWLVSYVSRYTGIVVWGGWIWVVAFAANILQRLVWKVIVGRRA